MTFEIEDPVCCLRWYGYMFMIGHEEVCVCVCMCVCGWESGRGPGINGADSWVRKSRALDSRVHDQRAPPTHLNLSVSLTFVLPLFHNTRSNSIKKTKKLLSPLKLSSVNFGTPLTRERSVTEKIRLHYQKGRHGFIVPSEFCKNVCINFFQIHIQ